MPQKRIAVIEDISCFGKCSLTVALPLFSAAGVEMAVIPTAVFSTHTGGFTGYTFRDLSSDAVAIAEHWNREGIGFDAVLTGYLCSRQQAASVQQAVNRLCRPGTLRIADPAMADHGRLYQGLSADLPGDMLALCRGADLILPNITEACLLLGKEYRPGPYQEAYVQSLLTGLYQVTGAKIVLTGVCFDEKQLGASVYDGKTVTHVLSERLSRSYHGTGDVFSSVLSAAVLNGKSLPKAARIAVDFTCDCIRCTMAQNRDERDGLAFEGQLSGLIDDFKK